MTQEQQIRRMLDGFVNDPPDSDYQRGFLAAASVIATEVMGFDWNDPLILAAENAGNSEPAVLQETVKKARISLTIIDGGKRDAVD